MPGPVAAEAIVGALFPWHLGMGLRAHLPISETTALSLAWTEVGGLAALRRGESTSPGWVHTVSLGLTTSLFSL